jgi:lysophospholipase L1-like esterase
MSKRLHLVCVLAIVCALCLSGRAQPSSNPPAAKPNPASGLTRCTTPVPRTGKPHERFLELNKRVKETGDKARLLFVGDSITQGWEGAGRNVWAKYYGHRDALNIGISGDRTEHVLWRLENGNIEGLKPKVAVLLIGVNNIPDESNSPGDVLAGVTAVVQKLRSSLPETKILVLGIFPFRPDFEPARGRALQVNQALYHLADGEHVFFQDFGQQLIQPDGKISKSIMPDFLHPNEAGYKIWAKAIEPKLAELLGDKLIQD